MSNTAVLTGERTETRSSSLKEMKALAFFGGGTGGHLFPGLAVAERTRERFPDCDIVFFRTRREVEEKVFANSGHSVGQDEPEAFLAAMRGFLVGTVGPT